MATRSRSLELPIALGFGCVILFLLAGLQLLASCTVDFWRPWQLLPLVFNPRQYFATVGGTIVLALAFGFGASVALNHTLAMRLHYD